MMPNNDRSQAPSVRPRLVVPRGDAAQKIQARIDKGLDIKSRPLESLTAIEELHPEKLNWSRFNKELLARLFDNDYYARQYIFLEDDSWSAMPLDAALYLFNKAVNDEINLLKSILDQLELIPDPFINVIAADLSERRETHSLTKSNQADNRSVETVKDPRIVFVIHGRNEKARASLFTFLRSIGLAPREWSELVQDTGRGSPYIGDILDVAFSKAQAVVVLMTPDDVAELRAPFRSQDDAPYESQLTGQARPNVLFEAGMAMGRKPDRTIIVELGILRPFSDIAGRHTVRLSNATQHRQELAQRLETAGCPVNLRGRDWHTEGEFNPDITHPGAPISTPLGKENAGLDSEAQARKDAHDVEIFRRADSILDEDKLDRGFSLLLADHSYRDSFRDAITSFCDFVEKRGNQYLNEKLAPPSLQLADSLKELVEFLVTHFFIYPEAQTYEDSRYCMQPDLNIDRAGKGHPEEMEMYDDYTDQLRDLVNKASVAYSAYRLAIKETLFI